MWRHKIFARERDWVRKIENRMFTFPTCFCFHLDLKMDRTGGSRASSRVARRRGAECWKYTDTVSLINIWNPADQHFISSSLLLSEKVKVLCEGGWLTNSNISTTRRHSAQQKQTYTEQHSTYLESCACTLQPASTWGTHKLTEQQLVLYYVNVQLSSTIFLNDRSPCIITTV